MAQAQNFAGDARIMIVDDVPSMRRSIRQALSQIGYENVVEASDGSLAWPIILQGIEESEPFDLVIADLIMEKMGGIALLKKVRFDKSTKSLPFIVLTGHGELKEVIGAAKKGADGYVIKPFSPEVLRARMADVFKVAQERAAA